MQLGELLVQKKVISQGQLDQLLTLQSFNHRMLGELLMERSLISAENLAHVLKEQYWRNNGYWVIG